MEMVQPSEWWADKGNTESYSEQKTNYQVKSKPRRKASLPSSWLHDVLFRPPGTAMAAVLCPYLSPSPPTDGDPEEVHAAHTCPQCLPQGKGYMLHWQ